MLHTTSDAQQSYPPFSAQLLRDLREAVADLKEINPWAGLLRFMSLGSVTAALMVLTWQLGQGGERIELFILGAIATSVAYSFWLICNHDATHRSLTGWNWFDGVSPRLISWPMLLPIGTYNQIHNLHHGWNGLDLRDPERVQWTAAEYNAAPLYQRWYVHYQWIIDIFILGSFGLTSKTLLRSLTLRKNAPALRQQMIIDAVGIVCTQGAIISLLLFYGLDLWAYLLFWVVLERGIGIIMQTRDHLEHYGLWQEMGSYQLTQLYACRNIKTFPWVNWLMGGLPYHSVHHAFPDIASNNLPKAFDRIQAVLQHHHLAPLPLAPGYLYTSFSLAIHPCLIAGSTDENSTAAKLIAVDPGAVESGAAKSERTSIALGQAVSDRIYQPHKLLKVLF